MKPEKRQPNENRRYKILGKLKLYRRDQKRCALAADDKSLPESTRFLYMRHLDHISVGEYA